MFVYTLFDLDSERIKFLPITYTRPVFDMIFGILTIREKWERFLNQKLNILTSKNFFYRDDTESNDYNIFINGSVCPCNILFSNIKKLDRGQVLKKGNKVLAFYPKEGQSLNDIEKSVTVNFNGELFDVNNIWDLFKKNDRAIELDFKMITRGRISQAIDDTNIVLGNRENIFLEEGVSLNCSVLNVTDGYMYFDKDVEVMEGNMVRGSFAMRQGAVLKMGSKVYGATTVGKFSKIGGEVSNSIIMSYSNKGHDGFLGNSIIGEWCNLGANTNVSNLKNNYSKVSIWDYAKGEFVDTPEQFLGLVMGDHSKSGINTMFNTGTVVGSFSNVFGGEFPPKYIPCFSWCNTKSIEEYNFDKAIKTASIMMERRNMELNDRDLNIYKYIFKNCEYLNKKI